MRIILFGDSTMQYNDASTYPQTGWGQMLPLFFNKEVEILNFAKNGCSTKSFIDLGIYDLAINEVKEGDYVVIQFGHNDQKPDKPERYTTVFGSYQENLRKMAKDVLSKGATPIFCTSIYRRFFDNGLIRENVHGDYPKALMQVAKEVNALCIDMTTITKELYAKMGDNESKRFFMIFDKGIYPHYPNGMYDNTHLRADGAYTMASIFVEELKKIHHPLVKYMVDTSFIKKN